MNSIFQMNVFFVIGTSTDNWLQPRDFGLVFHNKYQPLILQACCVPSAVRVLMTVKESNSQTQQQKSTNIQLGHAELQTLRLQNNAIKNIVQTDHVYSAILYSIIVFEGSFFENVAKFLSILETISSNGAGSRRRTYLELQLITRTQSKQSPVSKSSVSKSFWIMISPQCCNS